MNKLPNLKNITKPNYGTPAETQNVNLQHLGLPHVTSFNYMIAEGLDAAVKNLHPIEFKINDDRIRLEIVDASLDYPRAPAGAVLRNPKLYPTECRQRAATYKGKLMANVRWSVNEQEQGTFVKDMGNIPIMVKSNRCHLDTMTPKELVEHGEHEQEWGGYFVIKGHERLIRMLLMTRRNYPICIMRSGWKTRGIQFTEKGVLIRCVTDDQTATSNVLHYVSDGTARFMISHKKAMYYLSLTMVLKCLSEKSDKLIYEDLIRGYEDDSRFSDCIMNMLRLLHEEEKLHSHVQCRVYLGKMFRSKFKDLPDWYTDVQVAKHLIKNCILIHLDKKEDKYNALVFMTQKLFAFAQDKCVMEGADAVMMQEVLMGGHLYLQIVKEKLQRWLTGLKEAIVYAAARKAAFVLNDSEMTACAKRSKTLERDMDNFLATGEIHSTTGLGLMQENGLTIVAENINRMRYMSHFRAIHRGSFFQQMRTTDVRKLLPDAWGFICPVHTPDGAPCGLLNHLTLDCTITDVPDPEKVKEVPKVLAEMGMAPLGRIKRLDPTRTYVVQLDGKVLGHIRQEDVEDAVYELRQLKVNGERVPHTLEIVLVPYKKNPSQFQGLFLFTGPARMMRPVLNLTWRKIEYVGTFEQVYLDICVQANEAYKGITTHMELDPNSILSNLAQLIPMPDCNQSPRNMYQCQMGKQTMGTPCHNWGQQAETKLYRLQTPASPLFRPTHYDKIELDDFAMGTNAVVAVISYTGFDMEDAIIINKASEEKGLAHGSIYKSQFVELDHNTSYFGRDNDSKEQQNLVEYLDNDGLPYHGRTMRYEEPLCCYYSSEQSRYIVKKFKDKEECFVDNVRLCGDFDPRAKKVACITFRVPRNPTVGDKFASRAGQKGILSKKWPMEDLPFTETGMVPDIVFNPHGFPSRMTIAMIYEVMAGKSAAVHGLVHDATPFKFSEDKPAWEYFGKLMEMGGYNRYGEEIMYSGLTGEMLRCQIFTGIVHYQRLRHMVSDKWQVRSTGPIDTVTRQPLKGRKRGGGVRFGEMERDSLISHGAAFSLQDRLFDNSDKTTILMCTKCQSILSPVTTMYPSRHNTCRLCESHEHIKTVEIPHIWKVLVSEMTVLGIDVKHETKPRDSCFLPEHIGLEA